MIENRKTITKVCGVCYSDKAIEKIVNFAKMHNYKYYYILHYGDIENENIALDIDYTASNNMINRLFENNKYHYHFCIVSSKKHRFVIDSLIDDVEYNDNGDIIDNGALTNNLFNKLDDIGSYLRYMLHIDYDMKEHYIIDDIKSNDNVNNIEQLILKAENKEYSYNDVVFLVMDYIDSCDKDNITMKELLIFLKDNNIDIKRDYLPLIIMMLKDKKGVLIK